MRAKAPEVPTEQTKCSIAASSENPLVTEWPASEKANLEARLRQGAVAVEYSGCSMRLLPACEIPGQYQWRRTTTATDTLEIRDADELYAKLPLGAVSLEGELARSGRISVQTTVAGQLELRDFRPAPIGAFGPCGKATHVIHSLSVGAFKMRSGGTLKAGGGVDVQGVGASGQTQSSETLMREAGVASTCAEAQETEPNTKCRSPIQVFLRRLEKADQGPPGTRKVGFVSGKSSEQWDVMANGKKLCETPCVKWVNPGMPFVFHQEKSWYERNVQIEVPDLRDEPTPGPIEVKAVPPSTSELAGGVVLTTFGGIGVLTGIALGSIGCFGDNSSLCVAGAVSLPIGGLMLVPGIMLIAGSGSRADIRPLPSITGSLQRRSALAQGARLSHSFW